MEAYQSWRPGNSRRGAIFINVLHDDRRQSRPLAEQATSSSDTQPSDDSPPFSDSPQRGSPTAKRTRQNRDKSQRYHFRVKTQRRILATLHAELEKEAEKVLDAGTLSTELRQAFAHRRSLPTNSSSQNLTTNERKRNNKIVHRQRELEKLESISFVAAALLSRCENDVVATNFPLEAPDFAEEHIRWALIQVFLSWHREWEEIILSIDRTREDVVYLKGDPLRRLIQSLREQSPK
ncbi:hypothetical protein FA10DRAFT_269957 [Acaromyces ingoldii]|uniref:Uncharacterized protein n=1 Tax=Acaromyces ingoldii TaxID=215250 RepID=A0A316YAL6_9BASI|nr:hypothetical protein FA10DRAFT_269957 [Acaromyces ingoldii]PWN86870.1 hypothetical protein FA10DRAFT_269957 [Acaromyces ingoldii]